MEKMRKRKREEECQVCGLLTGRKRKKEKEKDEEKEKQERYPENEQEEWGQGRRGGTGGQHRWAAQRQQTPGCPRDTDEAVQRGSKVTCYLPVHLRRGAAGMQDAALCVPATRAR